jgi:predicted transcriptional regulator of viral defense system
MGTQRRPPGEIRDAIMQVFKGGGSKKVLSLAQVRQGVERILDGSVPPSSVRSYLQLAEKRGVFERVGRGQYRLRGGRSS